MDGLMLIVHSRQLEKKPELITLLLKTKKTWICGWRTWQRQLHIVDHWFQVQNSVLVYSFSVACRLWSCGRLIWVVRFHTIRDSTIAPGSPGSLRPLVQNGQNVPILVEEPGTPASNSRLEHLYTVRWAMHQKPMWCPEQMTRLIDWATPNKFCFSSKTFIKTMRTGRKQNKN